ncbi:MAG: response regulator transcription factor [Dehalococcoidia bacterium]
MHILIVEDDERLAQAVSRVLKEEGHVPEVAHDGSTGLDLAASGTFDLVILDLMLPRLSGLEVCRRLRAAGVATPVLMLTAREHVDDRVKGLDAGADDYLTKPFALTELLARIRALGRRRILPLTEDVLTVDDLEIDRGRRVVRRGRSAIELTAKEFALLEYLAEHPGQVLTRGQILDHVWGYAYATETNVVDIYIHYLRRKIDEGHRKKLIATVRGVGYRLGSGS